MKQARIHYTHRVNFKVNVCGARIELVECYADRIAYKFKNIDMRFFDFRQEIIAAMKIDEDIDFNQYKAKQIAVLEQLLSKSNPVLFQLVSNDEFTRDINNNLIPHISSYYVTIQSLPAESIPPTARLSVITISVRNTNNSWLEVENKVLYYYPAFNNHIRHTALNFFCISDHSRSIVIKVKQRKATKISTSLRFLFWNFRFVQDGYITSQPVTLTIAEKCRVTREQEDKSQ